MNSNSRPKTAKLFKSSLPKTASVSHRHKDSDASFVNFLKRQNDLTGIELKEEANKLVEMVKERKEKLKRINLCKEVNENIYKWNDLFDMLRWGEMNLSVSGEIF